MSKYEPKLQPTKRQLQIEAMLIYHNGNKNIAARELGIDRPSLNSSMQRLEAKRRRLAKIGQNG